MLVIVPKEQNLWVNTPHGLGMVFAIESFNFDNSIWTVFIAENGRIRHYNSSQLTVDRDYTSEINLKNNKPKSKKR